MKNSMLLTLMLLVSGSAVGQSTGDVEELKALGRDSLISRAVGLLQRSDAEFDPSQYDRIRVIVDEDDIIVRFEHSIAFYGRKTAYRYNATVNIRTGSTGSSIVSNPNDYDEDAEEYRFFRWDDKSRKAVRFVLDAINRQNEIGDIPEGKLPKDTRMTIREESGYYQIEVDSWSTHSYYKIKKSSGKIYDAGHKHYARDGDEQEVELEH